MRANAGSRRCRADREALARRVSALLAVLLVAACQAEPGPRLRRVPPGHDGALVTWWNDDQVREEGAYRDGLRHGHVRGFHAGGELAFEGDFVDGEPDGPQRAWHPDGALALEADYVRGLAQGERREHDERGVLRRRAAYVDGWLHGEELRYHANGRIARRGRNERGMPVAAVLDYDEQGRLVGETLSLRSGAEVGAVLETVYDPDGPARMQSLRVRRDGAWVGRVTSWRADGSLASVAELMDGSHHGRERTFDEHGRVRSEGWRAEGLRTGPWTWWDASGRVERTVVYEDGRVVPEASTRAAEDGEG